MAKQELTKAQKWWDEIILESFRSEKKVVEYMNARPEEEWSKVLVFSERASHVFGEVQIEDGELFENNKGQFINTECMRLYNISMEEFVQKFNLPDDDDWPVLIDYFKKYSDCPNDIPLLLPKACETIKTPRISRKADLKVLNDWAKKQIMEKYRPDFYDEEIYAYLIVILGEFFRNTKLHNARWKVLKRDIRHPYKHRPVDYIYTPYLVDENKVVYDVVQSFRQNLFLSGRASLLISRVYNNIQERCPYNEWLQKL